MGAAGTQIRNPAALSGEAGYLRSALGDVLRGGGKGGAVVRLSVDPKLDVDHDGKADAEGYTLRSTAGGVDIVGTDPAGVLYGVQTLRQLIPASAYEAAARGAKPSTVDVLQAATASPARPTARRRPTWDASPRTRGSSRTRSTSRP